MNDEIALLLNDIKKTNISPLNINTNQIEKYLSLLDKKKLNKIIHITNYDKNLICINIDIKCCKCNKKAIYQNQLSDKELYCWIHAHKII